MNHYWQPLIPVVLVVLESLILLTFMSPSSAGSEPSLDELISKADHLVTRRRNIEAQRLYKEALVLDVESSAAHAGLGWTLFDTGKHSAGLAEEMQAITLKPNNALAHHYLGSMLLVTGHPQEAADEYRLEYKIDPKRRCHCGPIENLLKQYPSHKYDHTYRIHNHSHR